MNHGRNTTGDTVCLLVNFCAVLSRPMMLVVRSCWHVCSLCLASQVAGRSWGFLLAQKGQSQSTPAGAEGLVCPETARGTMGRMNAGLDKNQNLSLHFSSTCLKLFWTSPKFSQQQSNKPWEVSTMLARWASNRSACPTGKDTSPRPSDTVFVLPCESWSLMKGNWMLTVIWLECEFVPPRAGFRRIP